jgi:RNA polymerase sigma factor (sigma-70 family)
VSGASVARLERMAAYVAYTSLPDDELCRRLSIEAGDLEGECLLAGLRAIGTFDATQGATLWTWVQQQMQYAPRQIVREAGRLLGHTDYRVRRHMAMPEWPQNIDDFADSLADTARSPESLAVDADTNSGLYAAMRTLTATQRDVIVLRYWHALTYATIGQRLRMSVGAVWQMERRALVRLRARLEMPDAGMIAVKKEQCGTRDSSRAECDARYREKHRRESRVSKGIQAAAQGRDRRSCAVSEHRAIGGRT